MSAVRRQAPDIFEPPTSVEGVGNIFFNNLELQVLSIVIK